MAGTDETILAKMEMDISDLEAKATKVDTIFKNLGTSVKSGFNPVTIGLQDLEGSISATSKAMNDLAVSMAKISGVKNISNASLSSAKSLREAAQAALTLQQANLKMEQTSLTAANALMTKARAADTLAAAEERLAKIQNQISQSTYKGVLFGGGNDFEKDDPWRKFHADAAERRNNLFQQMPGMVFSEQQKQIDAAAKATADFRKEMQGLKQEIQGAGGMTKWSQSMGLSHEQLSLVQRDLAAAGVQIKAMPTFWDNVAIKFQSHLVQWGLFSVAIGGAMALMEGLGDSIRRAGEAQEQLVQLHAIQGVGKAAGYNLGPASDSRLLNDASILAAQYGDNINDVIQDLEQWYKVTGDLNNAVFLTGNALKFQVASGTDLEDTYRTLTALSSQMAGSQMSDTDKDPFNLSKTPELLNMIYAAATAAGAGMRQVSQSGREIGGGTANAAEILVHSFEQDGEALKRLHLNMQDAIAINQSLIMSMGNTGSEANSTAEKISRLVGGIMELSKSSKVADISKAMGVDKFKEFQNILNKPGDPQMLEHFAELYEKLDQKSKNILDTTIAGTRQYGAEAQLVDAILTSFEKIKKAEEDRNALDKTANDMMDTFNQSVRQLQGEWSVVATIIGGPIIQALTGAMRLTAQWMNDVIHTADKIKDLNAGQTADALSSATGTPGGGFNYWENQKSIKLSVLKAVADHAKQLNPSEMQNIDTMAENQLDSHKLVQWLFETRDNKYKTSYGNLLYGDKANSSGVISWMQTKYMLDHPTDATAVWDPSHGLTFPPSANTGGAVVADPKATKVRTKNDLIKPWQAFNDSVEDQTSIYSGEIDVLNRRAQALETNVKVQERLMNIHGVTAQGVQALKSAYAQENAVLEQQVGILQQEDGYLNKQIDAAKHQMDVAAKGKNGKNSKEYQGWHQEWMRLNQEAGSVENNIQSVTDKINSHKDAVDAAAKKYHDLVNEWSKKIADEQSKGMESVFSALEANASPQEKSRLDALKEEIRLRHEATDAAAEYKTMIEQSNGDSMLTQEANNWYAVAQAALQADQVATQYKQHLEDLKNSDWYKAIEAGFNEIESLATTAITNSVFGDNTTGREIDQLNQEIELIKEKTTWSDLYYGSVVHHTPVEEAAHKMELQRYQEEIQAIKDKQKAIQDAANNNVVRKVAQAFGKELMSDLLKQTVQSMLSQMSKDPSVESMKNSLSQYVQATQGDLQTGTGQFSDAVKLLADPNMALTQQLQLFNDNFGQGGYFDTSSSGGTDAFGTSVSSLSNLIPDGGVPGIPDSASANLQLPFYAGVNDYYQTMTPDFKSLTPLLGNPGGVNGAGAGAALLGGGGAGGSFLGSLAMGGGNLLSKLAGGGSPFGLFGAGMGLLSEFSAGKQRGNEGSVALGSLAGVAGTVGLGMLAPLAFGGGIAAPGAVLAGLLSGPAGWAALLGGAVLGGAVGGLFGPHLNSQNAPDIFEQQDYGQGLANLGGAGINGNPAYIANGTSFTIDPALSQATGGLGQAAYISKFIASDATDANKLLTPQELQYFSGANGQEFYKGNGNVQLGGNNVTANWQDLTKAATDATQAIMNFKDATNQATQEALVSINLYGGATGFFPYNWSIPGYTFPANPNNTGQGNTGGTTGSPGGSSGGSGGSGGRVSIPTGPRKAYSSPVYTSAQGQPIYLNADITTNIDGRAVARTVQAYQVRANSAGYDVIS